MNRNLSKKGFTLLELIIVLALLAILASVAVARFVDLSKKAFDTQELVTINSLRAAVLLFKAMNGYWPAEVGKDGSAPSDRDIFALLENPPLYRFLQPRANGAWGILPGTWGCGGIDVTGYFIVCPHRPSDIYYQGDPGKLWFYSRQESACFSPGEIRIYRNYSH